MIRTQVTFLAHEAFDIIDLATVDCLTLKHWQHLKAIDSLHCMSDKSFNFQVGLEGTKNRDGSCILTFKAAG